MYSSANYFYTTIHLFDPGGPRFNVRIHVCRRTESDQIRLMDLNLCQKFFLVSKFGHMHQIDIQDISFFTAAEIEATPL
jgi:hypothetical protein